jgi:hypothetical protein
VTPKKPSVLPREMWEQLPVALQAVVGAMGAHYEQRIAALEAQVRELTACLHQTSQNSSKPPSSDGPHVKRKPPQPPSGRKPGGHSQPQVHRHRRDCDPQGAYLPHRRQRPGAAAGPLVWWARSV